MENLRSLIFDAAEHLGRRGVHESEREARSLLVFAIGKDHAFLRAHPDHVPSENERRLFIDAVNRRARREPFQHIVGKQEFFGLDFVVNEHVLVPRPETELIVEKVLSLFAGTVALDFCDVGTGSGCIATAVLKNISESNCIATDISFDAIVTARLNAANHGVGDRFAPVVCDVFDAFGDGPKFDLIVANPPYVPKDDFAGLPPEVRSFDPAVALTDFDDGLSIIRRIVETGFTRLKKPGWLVIEIGFNQAEPVDRIFRTGEWSAFEFITDLQGIPRIVCAEISD